MSKHVRASSFSSALLLGAALCLSACAERPPAQAAAGPARPVEQPAPKPTKVAKARRTDPNCQPAHIDLSSERKEALFRQFEAEVGPIAAPVSTDPAPVPRCKQAAQ